MINHPAKYTDNLLPVFEELLAGYDKVLDPFAGTGKLRLVRPDVYLLEIEPEWAKISGAKVGDALKLSDYWPVNFFDAICTSPTYGNRMADSFTDHQVEKQYRRNTYTHMLGRKLHPNNSGAMQWGDKYRVFHKTVWIQCAIVLRPGGRFILNISDHIRNGEVQHVTDWHIETLVDIGFTMKQWQRIKTPRQRYGANGSARVDCESVIVFEKNE